MAWFIIKYIVGSKFFFANSILINFFFFLIFNYNEFYYTLYELYNLKTQFTIRFEFHTQRNIRLNPTKVELF